MIYYVKAKCSALIWELQVSWGLGYREFELEGDNYNIIQTIKSNTADLRLQRDNPTMEFYVLKCQVQV